MKKILLSVLIAVFVITGVTAAVLMYQRFRTQIPSGKLILYGNVDIRQVDLAFNNSGRIATVLVKEGDRVNQGQLISSLDKARFKLAVEQTKASVQAQTQVVARLEAGSRPEEIYQAKANLEAAVAEVNDANMYYQRLNELVAIDAGAKQNRDDALARLRKAEAQLKFAAAELELMEKGPRKEDIATAKATLEANKAELEMKGQYLIDTDLFAPSDGVIQNRILEPGAMISPQRPVLTLALTDPVWVRAYVDEPDLGKIHPGMPATVTTDSFPDKNYTAWIGFISPTAEFTPKSVQTPQLRTKLVYQVRVFVNNPEDELRLGMPATVTIDLTRNHNTNEAVDTNSIDK